jgi:hypothetical protein
VVITEVSHVSTPCSALFGVLEAFFVVVHHISVNHVCAHKQQEINAIETHAKANTQRERERESEIDRQGERERER